MNYLELATLYKKLEETGSSLEKTKIIADFLKEVPEDTLSDLSLLISGVVFPHWSQESLDVGDSLIVNSISISTGSSKEEVKRRLSEVGDLGLVVEDFLKKKRQATLFQKGLKVEKVLTNLRKIAQISGAKAQDKKVAQITELLSYATPLEARYILRTVLNKLRIGVGEGIMKDAISSAFQVKKECVENAINLTNDIGEVAIKARKGDDELKNVGIVVGKPLKVMLSQKEPSIKDALERMEGKAAFEIKYDGMRAQVHKKEDKIWIFTRSLENITKQFPDIVSLVRKNVKGESFVIEGEIVAIDENRKPRPFQFLSQRIKRKYDIEKMVKEIPVEINLFDIDYFENKTITDTPFSQRRKLIEKIVHSDKYIYLADQVITDDLEKGEKFYKRSLDMGHEGVMVKNLDAPYKPGSRVGYMVKIKPIMETLDLAIIGATWGEGRRANWLASFSLACRDEKTGEFLEIGKMGSGLTDDQFKYITEELKKDILEQKGKDVTLKPSIVVEVAYEEIQKSPSYSAGFALRFPRMITIRADRAPEECDTIERIKDIYKKK